MGCSAGELGAWYYLPLVLRSYHYCHAYYCLASIVEMAISNKCIHSFQNVSSQVTLASIPYSLDIMPPFEYKPPPPLLFAKICCGGIFFSNLSPPSFIHCYYISTLICPMVQVDIQLGFGLYGIHNLTVYISWDIATCLHSSSVEKKKRTVCHALTAYFSSTTKLSERCMTEYLELLEN